jgi:DNA processing protein
MFAMDLVSSRERAAVLALAARRTLPWNRMAGQIEEVGSALALLAALEESTQATLFGANGPDGTLDELENQILAWEAAGIEIVTVLDDAYPVNLRMVHDRPSVLFVRGSLDRRDSRSVAVVGTRKASRVGTETANAVARDLVDAGYVVVSGLASGIDTAAHTATIGASGRTVAVIGTGLEHSYPRANAALQDRIAREAAVISQFWPDQGPRPWTFPQRNAVMSGFARSTVVIEASHTSGARMQARLALEHGRPVFLYRALLEHEWARSYSGYDGVYIVESGAEVVEHLDRLYSGQLVLAS